MVGHYAAGVIEAEQEGVVRAWGPTSGAELVADVLWGAGATAVSEEPLDSDTVLTAGFASLTDAQAAAAHLPKGWEAEVEAAGDPWWLDAWRAGAEPVQVGRLVVVPAVGVVRPPVPPHGVLVVIDPRRSYGWGGHPTTRLALAAVEALVEPGSRVLDVGTGSGILAVAASALGAREVVAVDLDPTAVTVTRENADANGVVVHARTGSVEAADGTFDLIVANLGGLRVVEQLAPAMRERLAPGGRLVVSGLLAETVDAAEKVLLPLPVIDRAHDQEWACLTVGESGP